MQFMTSGLTSELDWKCYHHGEFSEFIDSTSCIINASQKVIFYSLNNMNVLYFLYRLIETTHDCLLIFHIQSNNPKFNVVN